MWDGDAFMRNKPQWEEKAFVGAAIFPSVTSSNATQATYTSASAIG